MRFSKTRCKGTVFSAVKGFILICFPAVLTKFRNLTIKKPLLQCLRTESLQYLCKQKRFLMRMIKRYIGITLIVLGVVLFSIDYFAKFDSNALLLIGLASILFGVLDQIWNMKKENNGTVETTSDIRTSNHEENKV